MLGRPLARSVQPTIYSNDDRYRDEGLRTVVFMNENDMRDRGTGRDSTSSTSRASRKMGQSGLRTATGPFATRYAGCAAGYMRADVLCGIADVIKKSEKPVTKNLVVELDAWYRDRA